MGANSSNEQYVSLSLDRADQGLQKETELLDQLMMNQRELVHIAGADPR